MTRSTDIAPVAPVEIDIKALRIRVPQAAVFKESVGTPIVLPPTFIAAEQQRTVRALGEGISITPADRVVLVRGVDTSKVLMIARIADGENTITYIAPVEATAAEEYTIINTAEFVAGQSDLRSLLSMPIGFLAVIDQNGVSAVFDQTDQNRLKAAAPSPAAAPQ